MYASKEGTVGHFFSTNLHYISMELLHWVKLQSCLLAIVQKFVYFVSCLKRNKKSTTKECCCCLQSTDYQVFFLLASQYSITIASFLGKTIQQVIQVHKILIWTLRTKWGDTNVQKDNYGQLEGKSFLLCTFPKSILDEIGIFQ